MPARFISVKTDSQDLSAAALSTTTTFSRRFRLVGVYIHADAAITETVTITKDANAGSNYDTVLATNSLSAETDYVFRPTGAELCVDGDEIKVQCTQANATGTVYVMIYIEEY